MANNERSCGPCRVCCSATVLVYEDRTVKDFGVPCKHLNPKAGDCNGCTVYSKRPQACRDFVCSWLDEGIGKRPDKIGVLTESMGVVAHGDRSVGLYLCVEVELGSMRKGLPRLLISIGKHTEKKGHLYVALVMAWDITKKRKGGARGDWNIAYVHSPEITDKQAQAYASEALATFEQESPQHVVDYVDTMLKGRKR